MRTKQITVLKADLPYPNDVAVSSDRMHVVVAHMVPCQAFRYWLKGPKTGQYEVLVDMSGYPAGQCEAERRGWCFKWIPTILL